MKKNVLLILVACMVISGLNAQERRKTSKERAEEENVDKELVGFNPNKLFLGSGLNLGFGGGQDFSSFSLGLNPEIGYSLAKWLDVGVSININYFTFNEANISKQKSFNYGGGTFVRIYPISDFFIQALPEYNRINTKLNIEGDPVTYRIKQNAFSTLVGIGYGKRFIGESSFYTAILFDLSNSPNSPYVQNSVNGNSTVKVPVIRAGFNFYLRPKSRK